MRTGLGLLVVGLLVLIAGVASADPYFNSSEPGCGTDPNVLLCEDWENGVWYVTDCDSSGGRTNPSNKGWCGTIYANPIAPPKAISASGQGFLSTFAGNGGTTPQPQGGCTGGYCDPYNRNMAMHYLKTATCGSDGGQRCPVSELYVRWYAKWPTPYSFGAQKHMNITNSDGDIAFVNVQINCNGGSASVGLPAMQVLHGFGGGICQNPNVTTPFTLIPGRWYFQELHVRAGTNGLIEYWANDCGTDGKSCGASPILRTRMTGSLPGNSNGSQIETVHLENWSNPTSAGTGPLWDNLKVSRVGPIGFAGTSTSPPPTTSYQLTTAATGAGAVSGAGAYPSGTAVTPVALPASGSTFSGWSGDCTGTGNCTVTMTGNKAVTAAFTATAPPPPGTVPPAPSSPTVTLGTQDATGVTFNVAWPAVAGATSYSYTAGLSDGSSNLQGVVTPPNLLLKTPYMQNGAAGTGFVCVKSVNAAGSSADAACNGLEIPAKPAVIPPPLTTGTLTVDAQISRCTYFLTAEPPDAAGGWVAQFYRDGSNKVGNPISAAPYKRSVELYAPSHSFSVQFTKTGTVMRSPAVVTRACP